MNTKQALSSKPITGNSPRALKWPRLALYSAAIWSLLYGILGLYWALGGVGFPFGENDARGQMMGSFLSDIRADTGGIAIAITGCVSAAAALFMARVQGNKWQRLILLAVAWSLCAVFVAVIPDVRVLQNFAYAFMLHFHLLDWPVLNQGLCMAGGLIWGTAALAYQRQSRNACLNCGRTMDRDGASHAASWGKKVTYLSVIMALPYGIIRWAWAAGIPLGTNPELVMGQPLMDRISEIVLGGLTIGGALLTLGLIQRWGEVFPRWCMPLARKRVPIWLGAVPATLAAALMTNAGLKVFPHVISGIRNGSIHGGNWGELGPGLFWLPWGISLGAAALAYYLRRRGPCKHCGRK
ncbi:hypothetical protein [Paenibacillus lautus]|uniref:hypothetical protein n=1 Tax=Paenibacillus lautus TaxID=1401 RepID=UPI002DBC20C5|nr:hypothetical protein [Paenibacillus lautus]MEC0253849.1 hypothetical protein [Paenibacillus lautus]